MEDNHRYSVIDKTYIQDKNNYLSNLDNDKSWALFLYEEVRLLKKDLEIATNALDLIETSNAIEDSYRGWKDAFEFVRAEAREALKNIEQSNL